MLPLDRARCLQLADRIGDSPQTCIFVHALRTGICRAYATQPISRLAAAVVETKHTPGEPMAFGDDSEAIWQLLCGMSAWSCVEVAPDVAAPLGAVIARETGQIVHHEPDLFWTLTLPPPMLTHPAVRLLEAADADLDVSYARLIGGDPQDIRRDILDGPVAAAVIDGEVVAAVNAVARTSRYANIAATTSPGYRNRGLCTAAAALAARAVQAIGFTPVWSAWHGNGPSLRVAAKLGFSEIARCVYLVPRQRWDPV